MADRFLQTPPEVVEILRSDHVSFHPRCETFPLTGNLIPALVEGVIPRIITLCVRWKRPAFYFADRTHNPGRQNYGIRRSIQSIHDLLDRHDRPPSRQHGLLLNS